MTSFDLFRHLIRTQWACCFVAPVTPQSFTSAHSDLTSSISQHHSTQLRVSEHTCVGTQGFYLLNNYGLVLLAKLQFRKCDNWTDTQLLLSNRLICRPPPICCNLDTSQIIFIPPLRASDLNQLWHHILNYVCTVWWITCCIIYIFCGAWSSHNKTKISFMEFQNKTVHFIVLF